MKKTPITGRIPEDMARQIRDRAEAAGKSKTAILEEALESYFEGRQKGERITEGSPAVSLETVDLIRAVIREEVREALGPFRDAIQKNGRDTSVIHGRKEAPKRPKAPDPVSPGKLEEAADLVARVMQIKEAEGLTIREACRMAGTSWSTFQRRKKSLKAQEKDREEEEEAKT